MRILNTLETYAMLAVICLTSPFGLRDHALIRFLLLTGLRVGEVVGLNIRDVWVNGRPSPWLELPAEICKGHRARQIPLSPAAQRAVTDLVAFLLCHDYPGNVRELSSLADRLRLHLKSLAPGEALSLVHLGRVSGALPVERDEPALADLHRLTFLFNRRDHGRLRQLIDYLNNLPA